MGVKQISLKGKPRVVQEKLEKSDTPTEDTPTEDTPPWGPITIVKLVPTKTITDEVFFVIQVGPSVIGRITFGLYGEDVPKTVANFKAFATGNNPNNYSYKGTLFHRIIKGFMLQGGDFQNGDGSGGTSIYGPSFEDENFLLEHNSPGTLSMANSGPNTNRSQFFITTASAEKLNGKHVVFGIILEGLDLLEVMENVPVLGDTYKPMKKVAIYDCGMVVHHEPGDME